MAEKKERKIMAQVDEATVTSYGVRLKALHEDDDLLKRLKDFVHDLVAFKKNKRARRRILQEPTAEFYRSSVYFSPEQAHALLSFKRSDGVTLEQALQSSVARKLQQASSSYDLAPVFRDHFGLCE
jgi:hypothetical protein